MPFRPIKPDHTCWRCRPMDRGRMSATSGMAPCRCSICGPGGSSRRLATGAGTEGISISPDDRHVYASSVYINEIVKIDADTLQVVGRAKMGNCLGAVRVVPTPLKGTMLVVNCADNGRVLLVEAASLRVKHAIRVGALPIGIAVPDDRLAYVANMADDTISVIDISRGVVVRTIPAGDDPDGIVFVPD